MKYLIDFIDSASNSDIQNYLITNGCTVIKSWNNFEKAFLVESAQSPVSSPLVERVVEEDAVTIAPLALGDLSAGGNVDSYWLTHSDPNATKITIDTQDTKDWWKNYTYATPQFDTPSYQITRKGDNVTIYLIDSGVNASHPDFVNANIINLYSVVPGDFADNNGHGTALASVMVGEVCGISNATVKSVKIFDANHQTMQSELLDALDSIINDHVDGTISIANCSWAIPKNEWVEHKLLMMYLEGINIICSAGNDGSSIEDVTPASMPEALTVGAYNKDLVPCDFSNYTGGGLSVTQGATNHGELDGWAPGEEIWVADKNTNGYMFSAGTSISAAIVSAVLSNTISNFAEDDGQIWSHYSDMKFSSLQWETMVTWPSMIFTKTNLLDLSDPKYSTSKNHVLGLIDKAVTMNNRQTPDELVFVVTHGMTNSEMIVGRMFNCLATKHIAWVNPLPAGFRVTSEGTLICNPSTIAAPASGTDSLLHQCVFTRTNTDDTVENVTVDIYVISSDFDKENNSYPEDHPINIQLQIQSCSASVNICPLSGQNTNPGGCTNQCGGGRECCGPFGCPEFSKIYGQCICAFSCTGFV